MNDTESYEIDSYEPDWSQECDCCGQNPTVTAVKDGKVVADFNMCGVCTFGTAKALDPTWWNEDD
jgi:hypothetical protein